MTNTNLLTRQSYPYTYHEGIQWGMEAYLHSFLALAMDFQHPNGHSKHYYKNRSVMYTYKLLALYLKEFLVTRAKNNSLGADDY